MKAKLAAAVGALLWTMPAFAADRPAPPPPAQAIPPVQGYLAIGAGWLFQDPEAPAKVNTVTLDGAVNMPFFGTPYYNVELEGTGRTFVSEGASFSDQGVFAHAYWRDSNAGVLGLFGGWDTQGGFPGVTRWSIGGEAQAFLGPMTVYLQAAFQDWARQFDDHVTDVFVRGAFRYFVTPNVKLQTDVVWTRFNSSLFDPATVWSLQGSIEARLPNTPLAGFANVRWDRFPDSTFLDSSTTVLLGLKAYVGSGSSLDNDRRGAALDVLPGPTGLLFAAE